MEIFNVICHERPTTGQYSDIHLGQKLLLVLKCDNTLFLCTSTIMKNKPKGLKVAKEDQRLIGSMVNGLNSMVDRLDG